MKYLLVLLFALPAFAKEYQFTYNMPNGKKVDALKVKVEGDTWTQAFKRGANMCYDFFIDKKELTEDRILDITDTCANPSEK